MRLPLRTEEIVAFIRHPKDFFAGLLFIAFGVAAIAIGSNYALGTAARMGPGYFPRILGLLLIALGLALALRALRLSGPPVPAFKWRPLVIVLGSVSVFGMVVNYAGVVLSTVLLIVASSAASHEFRVRESLISGVALAALAVGVFVIGLKLQLPIWPAIF
jgi:Tripartite tricarboxylate transporter TctB family